MRKNPRLLGRVDEMMFHIWRHAEDQSLWALNCLIYCGARATILLAKDDKGKHALHERIDDEGDEEATMPVERPLARV